MYDSSNQQNFTNSSTIYVNSGIEFPLVPANVGSNWSSSNTSVATVDDDGIITTLSPGTTTITASVSTIATYSMTVEVLLPDGEWYIKNEYIDYYIEAISNNGIYIEVYDDSVETQKWIITNVEDNLYTILSNNNMALTYNANSSNITLSPINNSDNQIWRLNFIESWKCTITPKLNTSKCLQVYSNNNNTYYYNIDDIPQSGEEHIWKMVEQDSKVAFLSIDDRAFDLHVNNIIDVMEFNGMERPYIQNYVQNQFSVDSVNNHLGNYEILIFSMHGNPNYINLNSEPSNNMYSNDIPFYIAHLYENNTPKIDLSHVKLVFLMTCHSASGINNTNLVEPSDITGDPQNILEALLLCGAQNVVGFNCAIGTIDTQLFTEELFRYLYGYEVPDNHPDIEYYRTQKNIFDALSCNDEYDSSYTGGDFCKDAWVLGVQDADNYAWFSCE